jgi:hypothetical protein
MMVAPTAAELLTLWERCLPLAPIGRAVAMLELTNPVESHAVVAALPLGARDVHLLRLRARVFGSHLSGITPCPNCGEAVELAIDADDLLSSGAASLPADVDELTVDHDGYHVSFRLPTSADMASLSDWTSDEDLDRALLGRCLRWAEQNGSLVGADELPADVIDAVAATMAANDPMAMIEFACTCPACDNEWLALLDMPAFLWAELDDFAKHLLRDVHVLASGYGWPESEILALTPTRRQIYLDLVAG